MFKLNIKLLSAAALCAALLAGCGGGGDGNGNGLASLTQPAQQTVTAVADFIKNLFVSNGENSDPIDINSLTLAVDDTAEPAPVE